MSCGPSARALETAVADDFIDDDPRNDDLIVDGAEQRQLPGARERDERSSVGDDDHAVPVCPSSPSSSEAG